MKVNQIGRSGNQLFKSQTSEKSENMTAAVGKPNQFNSKCGCLSDWNSRARRPSSAELLFEPCKQLEDRDGFSIHS